MIINKTEIKRLLNWNLPKDMSFFRFLLLFFVVVPFVIGVFFKLLVTLVILPMVIRIIISTVLVAYTVTILVFMFRLSVGDRTKTLISIVSLLGCVASIVLAGSHSPFQLLGGLLYLKVF